MFQILTLLGRPSALHSPGDSPRRLPFFRSEASSHKRRLRCDTNISPRRLMTHLLHQMVHHCTTIARITTHTHTTILKTKRKSSKSCDMRYLLRVTLIHRQGWVQDGTPYSTSSGTKSGSSSVKIKSGVSTNVLSKSNHTHGGGINRVYAQDKIKDKVRI